MAFIFWTCSSRISSLRQNEWTAEAQDTLRLEGEKHLKNIRQLTFGGNNAEAYWSFDGKKLSFQSDNPAWGNNCDQIYYLDVLKDDLRDKPAHLISVEKGRNTCSFFMPETVQLSLPPRYTAVHRVLWCLKGSLVANMCACLQFV
ncbi:MAG: hypothetical protein U0T81_01880 [Saprospiraceae bacterium]